jgi:hypothetical protein
MPLPDVKLNLVNLWVEVQVQGRLTCLLCSQNLVIVFL